MLPRVPPTVFRAPSPASVAIAVVRVLSGLIGGFLANAVGPYALRRDLHLQVIYHVRARRLPEPVALTTRHQMHGGVDAVIETDVEAVGRQAGEQAAPRVRHQGPQTA